MSLRSMLSGIRAKWEGSFDRATGDRRLQSGQRELARDEFIGTLIIDHGAAPREFEGITPSSRLRD